MLSQYQMHQSDNKEAAERRKHRIMELFRQSNQMLLIMCAQIEAMHL